MFSCHQPRDAWVGSFSGHLNRATVNAHVCVCVGTLLAVLLGARLGECRVAR